MLKAEKAENATNGCNGNLISNQNCNINGNNNKLNSGSGLLHTPQTALKLNGFTPTSNGHYTQTQPQIQSLQPQVLISPQVKTNLVSTSWWLNAKKIILILIFFLKSFLETVHEEDYDNDSNYNHQSNDHSNLIMNGQHTNGDENGNLNKYSSSISINNDRLKAIKTINDVNSLNHSENLQLYEQLNQLKPLKNYKTTKNIILNEKNSNELTTPSSTDAADMSSNLYNKVSISNGMIMSNDTTTKPPTPSTATNNGSLKRSYQIMQTIPTLPIQPIISNKLSVRFNDAIDNSSTSRDSIASNDSNDTIIEADISSLSNYDSATTASPISTNNKNFNNKRSINKSDFFEQHKNPNNFFLTNANYDNLSYRLTTNPSIIQPATTTNLARRNSMPAATVLPVHNGNNSNKRSSLNVTDL